MKARRTEHLRYLLSCPQKWNNYWPAYKISLQRGYNITEIVLWCDYVVQLPLPNHSTSSESKQNGNTLEAYYDYFLYLSKKFQSNIQCVHQSRN